YWWNVCGCCWNGRRLAAAVQVVCNPFPHPMHSCSVQHLKLIFHYVQEMFDPVRVTHFSEGSSILEDTTDSDGDISEREVRG
ncbi:hypothetical protein P4O66_023120, partial [Electrophorus voltai]